jgi:glycosyltransferase involved in cell wall biosynthesis
MLCNKLNIINLEKLTGGFDVFHSMSIENLPIKNSGIKFLTVHDLIPIKYDQYHPKPFASLFKRQAADLIINSDKIIAISESTKFDIMRSFAIDENKIFVIYPGKDPLFRPINDVESLTSTKSKYGINSKYILSVCTLEPRKNLVGLVKAYKILLNSYKCDHDLVIVGKKGWLYQDIYKESASLGNKVKYLGFVGDKDLVCLYNSADLFVYPSFYEGFGLPVLEAMSCGTPIITSNTSSLPEVVGDAGILVDPNNIEEIAYKMNYVLINEALKLQMRDRGITRSNMFSWESSANKLLKLYKEYSR